MNPSDDFMKFPWLLRLTFFNPVRGCLATGAFVCCFLPILIKAESKPSAEQTLEWINAKLQETGSGIVISSGVNGGSSWWKDMNQNYRVALSSTGSLEIKYDNVSQGSAAAMNSTDTYTTVFPWKSASQEDLIIGKVSQIYAMRGWKERNRAILTLRTAAKLEFLIPLPESTELQDRFLAAFRNLLAKAKAERKEPF